MKQLKYTQPARKDLVSIARYTTAVWGEAQAACYLDQLETACERLLSTPLIGRECDGLQPGLRKMENGKHVIFYVILERKIRIARIFHQQMIPTPKDFRS